MSPAERLDRFRLEGVIGVGSFATVHLARDDRLDDLVVLKVLAENHSLNPEVRERFITEGRALRRVDSPHVVTLFDMGESGRQQPYHVLEHADRGTLAQRVEALRAEGWTASADEVRTLARQLASALTAVHAARLVHRDLSPANVLLTSSGTATDPGDDRRGRQLVRPDERVLVADLGMCKDLALNSGLTVAGGTTGFRPPELAAGPALIDGRADLWSLSALLAWVCEGADLPPAFTEALARGTALDPDDRQPGVEGWLVEVEAALGTARPAAGPPSAAGPDTEGEPRTDDTTAEGDPARDSVFTRRRLLVAALVAALLLGGLVSAYLVGAGAPDATTATAEIGIDGPGDLTVGQTATFTLEQDGVRSWVWTLPDGRFVVGEAEVTLTPTSSGTARVVLTGLDEQGRELRVTHDVQVEE